MQCCTFVGISQEVHDAASAASGDLRRLVEHIVPKLNKDWRRKVKKCLEMYSTSHKIKRAQKYDQRNSRSVAFFCGKSKSSPDRDPVTCCKMRLQVVRKSKLGFRGSRKKGGRKYWRLAFLLLSISFSSRSLPSPTEPERRGWSQIRSLCLNHRYWPFHLGIFVV